MDAWRAQAFVGNGTAMCAATNTGCGRSGESGESMGAERDISLVPLLPPAANGRTDLPDHLLWPDRGAWTPVERARYCAGCILALERLRARLERGLAVLNGRYTLAGEILWLTLATRAMRLIGRMARASPDAEAAFLDSQLGRWYSALEWPVPSLAACRTDW
jgi:hypothetical protein